MSSLFSPQEKKLLFSLRTRSVPVKRNYSNKYKPNLFCNLCENQNEEESEMHILRCEALNEEPINDEDYEDIYSDNLEKQQRITQIFQNILKKRRILLQN